MSEQSIVVRTEGHVTWLLFNRPAVLNAMRIEDWKFIGDRLEELRATEDLRCLVLAGEGRAFLAGNDRRELKEQIEGLQAHSVGHAEVRDWVASEHRAIAAIRRIECPVIAAVQGYALGAGCGVAAGCDLVVADRSAKFGLPEITVGAVTNAGLTYLARRIGTSRAGYLAFTGEPIGAEEAHRIGLADVLAPDGEVRSVAERLAHRIAAQAPVVLGSYKKILRCVSADVEAAQARELDYVVASLLTEDNIEGSTALLQRRQPNFKGR